MNQIEAQLFLCPRYESQPCRLLPKACARRYHLACVSEARRKRGVGGTRETLEGSRYTPCIGCETGKQNLEAHPEQGHTRKPRGNFATFHSATTPGPITADPYHEKQSRGLRKEVAR